MSYEAHRAQAAETPVRCAVLTVSDTRTPETDQSGRVMKERLERAHFDVVLYRIVPDDPPAIRALLGEWTDGRVDAILLNGGTGISRRDRTFEAVSGLLEQTLPGFGELFRMLSYQEIGSGALLSRAVAGVYRGTLVFCTPGSPGAVALAMDRLIVPELRHLTRELSRP